MARRDALVIACAVLIGAALRSWHIGFNFDGDEMFSVALASDSFAGTIARSLADTPHPPLHNILLHAWIWLFGPSEVSARSLSVLFSCGLIVLAFKIARRYGNAWSAYGVAGLTALSPLLIYYGQEARPYALVAFLSAANLYAFLKTLDTPGDKRRLAIWGITGAALLLSQYLGVVFLGLEILWAFAARRPKAWRYLLYVAPGVGLLTLWAAAAMSAKAMAAANPLPQLAWIGKPHPGDFPAFYAAIFGIRFWRGWLFAILAVPAFAYLRHAITTRRWPTEHLLFAALAFGMPLAAFVVSILGPQPIFAARQMIGAAVAMLILVGLAANTLPRWAATAVLVCLMVWSATSARMAQPDVVTPPWREIARWIDHDVPAATVAANEPFCQRAISYYRAGSPVLLWADIPDSAKSKAFLFACRPATCGMAIAALNNRASLIKTWRWDRYAGKTPTNQLLVYRVSAEDQAATKR